MTQRLENRVAIITGGASGIGLATGKRLLAEGARLVIADVNPESVQAVSREFDNNGLSTRCATRIADVSDEADVAALVRFTEEHFGGLDIAFLNAGVGGAFGSVTELETTHWDETFALLVRSVFLGIKYCSPAMSRRGGGSIIATSSVAGLSGGAGGHPYSAAKAAVVSLVRSTAIELAARHIRVNSVAPGLVATPLVHRGDETRVPPVSAQQPWPEIGQPEHIAGVVAFLASDDAAFVTGETIAADGGLTANGANLWDGALYAPGLSGMNRGSTGKKPTINN